MRPPGRRIRAASADGMGGLERVVQRLAKKGEIDARIVDGRGFEVAEAVFEVCDPVIARQLRTELNHFRRVVDGDDPFGALGQQLRKSSFACPEIGNDTRLHQFEQGFGESFPRATRHIGSAEFTRELVKIRARPVRALAERKRERRQIAGAFREFPGGASMMTSTMVRAPDRRPLRTEFFCRPVDPRPNPRP